MITTEARERKKARDAARYANNKTAELERNRKWRAANREKVRESERKWRAARPEIRREAKREACRQWYASNQVKAKEAARSRYNPKKARENKRARREADPEGWRSAQRERERKWHAAHPEVGRAKKQRRRASIKTSTANAPTTAQLKALLKKPCHYCGARAEHVDHYIPLAKGGTHTLDNLRAACAPCNLSKGAKLPDEWGGRLGSKQTP